MTHRDRAGDPPGRREAAGDAGHRQGFPTPAGGSPARPSKHRQRWRVQMTVLSKLNLSDKTKAAMLTSPEAKLRGKMLNTKER